MKLVIIDANALIHRAYHALPKMTDSKGRLVNAVYGFTSILLKTLSEIRPEYVVAAFDLPAPTFRHKKYQDYKGTREKGKSELYEQFPLVKKILQALNIPIYEKKGFEADDVIGTISKNQKQAKNIIITGDLDTLQLVDENTIVITPGRGVSKLDIYNRAKIKKRYFLKPSQVPDLKGLKGDPSDNIPGVKGIGEKTAIELLKKYKTIEGVYENLEQIKDSVRRKLEDQEDSALFSKELATIVTNVPIKFDLRRCLVKEYKKEEAEKVLLEFGFKSLLRRLPAPKLSEQIFEIENLLEPILRRLEGRGVRLDAERLEKIGKSFEKKLNRLRRSIFKRASGEFNILSPSQVKKISKKMPDILPLIKDYRSLYKLKSSYVDSLPILLQTDGKIHTTYKAMGAETGRLSSSEPNLQNIPEIIKSVFIADTGLILISADYSQIELRIVASISEDEKLIDAFQKNKDVHIMTAANLFQKEEGEVTPKERQQAKTLNFSIIYGISSYGLAMANSIPIEEAQAFIDEYLGNFSGVAAYIEKTKEFAKKHGYVETILGRKRYIDIKERGWQRVAINHPVQGTQADIIKLAMIKLDKEVKEAPMILQVHDELVFEVRERDYKKHLPKIRKIMEEVFPLKVPLRVDIKVGHSWGEMERV